MAALLSSSLLLILARISDFHVRNINSASVEYPPLSFVIFGSRICQNSLDACTAAAADTSATIVVACLDSSIRGAVGSTSNVQFYGIVR